jgi:tRNA-dihydrouridine synthase A
MMDWTTRHCRVFHRLLSPHARLYTEMVTTGALLHGDITRHLDFDVSEHPVALQLGGSEPGDLAACAKMAGTWGYDEINLNCGCPSERVQKGAFGACLMNEPSLVAACVSAMRDAAPTVPVTVKCRIGIDDVDPEPFLDTFVRTVAAAGCDTFIIHARKALLKGLSPKENRDIPPLDYPLVARIKNRYPHLTIILNGGLKTIEQVLGLVLPLPGGEVRGGQGRGNAAIPRPSGLTRGLQDNGERPSDQVRGPVFPLDGVMIGREAYQNPYFLAELDHHFYGTPLPDRANIVDAMNDYMVRRREVDPGLATHTVARHMLGLYHGMAGARAWRQAVATTTTTIPRAPWQPLADYATIASS